MADTTPLFVGIIGFWIMLVIVGGFIGSSLTTANSDLTVTDSSNWVDNFSFLFQIMFFQITSVPAWISWLVDSIAIFTLFVIVNIARGS